MTMNKQNGNANREFSRRQFFKRSSLALAGAAAAAELRFVHAAGADADFEVKIGLIGCGGRGTGAVLDAMGAATKVIYPATGYHTEDAAQGATIEKKNIKVVAALDRHIPSGAQGGPLYVEIRSALYDYAIKPTVIDYIYGIGGRDLQPSHLRQALTRLAEIEKTGEVGPHVDFLNLRE